MVGAEIIQKSLGARLRRAWVGVCYAQKDSANRAQSSLLELPRCSLSYVNLSKSIQNQTESGRSPGRDFLYLGTLRVEIIQKLNSKINQKWSSGTVPNDQGAAIMLGLKEYNQKEMIKNRFAGNYSKLNPKLNRFYFWLILRIILMNFSPKATPKLKSTAGAPDIIFD